MVRSHQPMESLVHQLGVTSYYVAHANNPLVIGRSDPNERSYFSDYLRYVDSARPRFAVVFYGLVPATLGAATIAVMRWHGGQLLFAIAVAVGVL